MFWNTKKSEESEYIDYSQKIIDLKEQYIDGLQTIKSVAQSDIESWKNYLNEVGVTPVGEGIRSQAKDKGLNIPTIAFPSEYRAVLVIFKEKAKTTVKGLKEEIEAAQKEIAKHELEDFTDKYLNKIVKKELKRYLELAKPKVSVADIFANASTSLNKFSPKEVGDKSYSIKCKTCGAARLEEDQYEECFYCGTPLFKK